MTLDRSFDVVVQLIRYAYETGLLAQGTLCGLADQRLSHALVMIHNDPVYPWTLQKLAEVCSMSRSKFAKHFHDVIAATPADYLTERRMLLAQTF